MSRELHGFPGTKRYVPKRLLGMGGMGAVYEVEDRVTGGRLALKVMLDADAGRLMRFKQEFRVMAELHHPNLVRLFDLGQHEGQWFFTMELVEGGDLLAVLLTDEDASRTSTSTVAVDHSATVEASVDDEVTLESQRRGLACDPDALVRVVAQILDALEYLHGRGIVHRDLKPSNILVDLEGAVRVLDFGLASRLDRAAAISQEGAVVGTLAYLSPEQYRGEPASAASDLYALGVIMFQLLTGDLPFQGPPMLALAARNEHPPPRIDARVNGAPPALADLVERLMARDPADRPIIAEVRAALGIQPSAGGTVPARRGEDTAEIFVGRQRELSILAGCLERAAGGQAQLALVSGPSGIGKSALGVMVERRAARLGFLCLRGRCYEREQVPFIAFDRVIDALTLALRSWPPALLASLRPSLVALERIFPALGMLTRGRHEGRFVDDASARAADPRELRRQALDGFLNLVTRCQEETPLCFVLDDLQWADDDSVALLSAMIADGAGRIMVLGLHRSESVVAGQALDGLLRGLADPEIGADHVTTIALDPLGPLDAALLVRAVAGGALETAMSGALVDQAGGNPFLVRRLAEHLATLGPAEQTAGLDAIGSADDLLRKMMAGLSPRAEQVLALAATAGGDVASPLLREASDLGSADLDLAIGELTAGRFLKAVPPQPGEEALPRFDLYHDRIREVAYQSLADDRRRALHRRLARAIEARADGRDAEVLVRHWTGAGERAEARKHAVAAAEQAAAKLAFGRAARLIRIVLDDPEAGEDPRIAAARWERAGDLYEYAGMHLDAARAYQEACRRWEEAPGDHPDRAVARLRLLGLTGENLMATEHIAEGRAAFARGLEQLGLPLDRPLPERIAVMAALKARVVLAEQLARLPLPRHGDAGSSTEVRFFDRMVRAFQPLWPAPAAEAALRAELLGRRLADHSVLLRSIASGAIVPFFLGKCSPEQLDEAHLRLDTADDLARDRDIHLGRELVQLHRSLLWLTTSGERARRTCESALSGIARRGLGDSFDGTVARIYYLYVLVLRGDDDDALAAAESEISRPNRNFINQIIARTERGTILARRGLLPEARENVDHLRALLAGAPPTRLDFITARAITSLALAEGRFADVISFAVDIERKARATGVWALGLDRSMWVELYLDAALGQLRRGALSERDRDAARAHAGWLTERGALDFGCLGYRARALLHDAEGRRHEAIRAIRRALSLSAVNTTPYHRWRCLTAARDLRVITLDQEAEAAELQAAGHFAAPPT